MWHSSAAVKAACQAKAPRRTVAAVAAVVTTVLLQPVTVTATPARVPDVHAGPPESTEALGVDELEQRLRQARAAKRQSKRQRRTAKAKAAADCPEPQVDRIASADGADATQPCDEPAISCLLLLRESVLSWVRKMQRKMQRCRRQQVCQTLGVVGSDPNPKCVPISWLASVKLDLRIPWQIHRPLTIPGKKLQALPRSLLQVVKEGKYNARASRLRPNLPMVALDVEARINYLGLLVVLSFVGAGKRPACR